MGEMKIQRVTEKKSSWKQRLSFQILRAINSPEQWWQRSPGESLQLIIRLCIIGTKGDFESVKREIMPGSVCVRSGYTECHGLTVNFCAFPPQSPLGTRSCFKVYRLFQEGGCQQVISQVIYILSHGETIFLWVGMAHPVVNLLALQAGGLEVQSS